MREYLTRILSEHVQVEAVADGASALAAAQERVPDLVLTDVMMPGLDGFELLKALRADPHTREIPIILLSARAGEESVVEGLQAGADDYLLTNAIKFTRHQGSINVELTVIEPQNSSNASIAEISITDTGIGICAEFLPHVFERFRQAEESNSSKGLGLGLAIARHLVELHNGTIRAESAGVGQGATFIVRLPLLADC